MLTESDMEAIGEYLKRKRAERGLSARQLARAVGMSDAHVIYIEKGKRTATFPKIMNMLSALGADFEEMMAMTGLGSRDLDPLSLRSRRRIPVVTLVMAGMWREVCDSFEPGDADEWIDSDVRGENVFALRVSGDSMEPEFKEGEVIVVNPHVEAGPNDYVVVKNRNEEATFKQLKRYGSRWFLHPLNPSYHDQEVRKGELRIIGRVVKKEKRY